MTERLIKEASEDYVKVMVDYNLASKKRRGRVDTGKFENIYDAKVGKSDKVTVEKTKDSLALDLLIKGETYVEKRRYY